MFFLGPLAQLAGSAARGYGHGAQQGMTMRRAQQQHDQDMAMKALFHNDQMLHQRALERLAMQRGNMAQAGLEQKISHDKDLAGQKQLMNGIEQQKIDLRHGVEQQKIDLRHALMELAKDRDIKNRELKSSHNQATEHAARDRILRDYTLNEKNRNLKQTMQREGFRNKQDKTQQLRPDQAALAEQRRLAMAQRKQIDDLTNQVLANPKDVELKKQLKLALLRGKMDALSTESYMQALESQDKSTARRMIDAVMGMFGGPSPSSAVPSKEVPATGSSTGPAPSRPAAPHPSSQQKPPSPRELAADYIVQGRKAGVDPMLFLQDPQIPADVKAQIKGMLAGEKQPKKGK